MIQTKNVGKTLKINAGQSIQIFYMLQENYTYACKNKQGFGLVFETKERKEDQAKSYSEQQIFIYIVNMQCLTLPTQFLIYDKTLLNFRQKYRYIFLNLYNKSRCRSLHRTHFSLFRYSFQLPQMQITLVTVCTQSSLCFL